AGRFDAVLPVQHGGEEVARLGGELVQPVDRVGGALLDRGAACALHLHLEGGGAAVQVSAGAGLEPAAAPLHVLPVAEQVGGIEVDGGVGEAAAAVDLQLGPLPLGGQAALELGEGPVRHQ